MFYYYYYYYYYYTGTRCSFKVIAYVLGAEVRFLQGKEGTFLVSTNTPGGWRLCLLLRFKKIRYLHAYYTPQFHRQFVDIKTISRLLLIHYVSPMFWISNDNEVLHPQPQIVLVSLNQIIAETKEQTPRPLVWTFRALHPTRFDKVYRVLHRSLQLSNFDNIVQYAAEQDGWIVL
jgi:hypothetical protein